MITRLGQARSPLLERLTPEAGDVARWPRDRGATAALRGSVRVAGFAVVLEWVVPESFRAPCATALALARTGFVRPRPVTADETT